jgi:hypothetical protein
MAILTRLFNFKGSIEIAEMKTTAGETCLNSSGSDLLQGPEVAEIPTEDVKRNPTQKSKAILLFITSPPILTQSPLLNLSNSSLVGLDVRLGQFFPLHEAFDKSEGNIDSFHLAINGDHAI